MDCEIVAEQRVALGVAIASFLDPAGMAVADGANLDRVPIGRVALAFEAGDERRRQRDRCGEENGGARARRGGRGSAASSAFPLSVDLRAARASAPLPRPGKACAARRDRPHDAAG